MKKKRIEPKRKPAEKIADICLLFSLFTLLLGALPILSFLGTVLFYLVVVLLIVCTVFLIFLDEGFRNWISEGPRALAEFGKLTNYLPFILGISSILSIFAIVIYAKSKDRYRRSERILAGVVLAALSIAAIIVLPKFR